MTDIPTADIERKSTREQAALYEQVFKALGQHRQQIRKDEAALQTIRRVRTRGIMPPNP